MGCNKYDQSTMFTQIKVMRINWETYNSSDGKFLYVGGNDGDDINKYSLTTPYNITSISLETSYSISAQTGDMRGFIFSSNFTKLYVTGDNGGTDDVIYEYDVDCAGTITCLDASTNADVKAIIEANVESAKI